MTQLEDVFRAVWRDIADLVSRTERLETQEAQFKWSDWTPTVTQNISVTVTITEAKYALIDKVAHIYAKLAVTSSGSSSGSAIRIGGSTTAATPAVSGEGATMGTCWVQDSGTANYFGFPAWPNDGSGWILYDSNARAAIGANPLFALANGDTIWFQAIYRIT